ncbi:copper chaperone PCu(A)C [Falsiroseomonas oryziterrae]|uniref:copper chaperone PCu(A)C n=1 Tax=Falsiroseomonas oryziterrae TaxID=2911368 RepID=UPI001F3B7D7A|nr:copper chaperone PCu(A)C [Roseomonas sp. NPKOSM-4]
MSFVVTRRAALGAMAGLGLSAAQAQDASIGPLRVSGAWTRAAGAGATGVGYMTLRNTGTSPDRLVSARTPAARSVELHTHVREGDVMRMRPVSAIDLPAGQEVRLQPGGLHLMLIGLTAPLRQGDRVAVTLVFERAGETEVQLAVEAAGARTPQSGGHRH